jgi:prepilin peptidase CpaA
MNITFLSVKTFLAGALLIAAVVTDLRTKKVPNRLIVGAFVVALLAMIAIDGFAGYLPLLASLGTALVFSLPLYFVRAIGGGDFKLILVTALFMNWHGVIVMVVSSMLWGSLLGVTQAVLKGHGKQLATNLFSILMKVKPDAQLLHKMPFTVAILFGWLTHLTFQATGVEWI